MSGTMEHGMSKTKKTIKKSTISKKRVFNLIELGLQIILILSMVLLDTVTLYDTTYSATDWTSSTTFITTHMSLLECYVVEPDIFGFISLALMGINAILCFVSIFEAPTNRDGSSHVIVPMVNLFFGIWIFTINASEYYDVLELDGTYSAFGIVCLIAIVVLAIIKRTSLVVPTRIQQSPIIVQGTSQADELKRFKELLDSGVITPEEFDAKKKQLLGV